MKIQESISSLHPFIQRDVGEFVDYADFIVYVRLLDACSSCPSSHIALKMGIERALFQNHPEMDCVEQVF